jgi:hypothetical protein
MATLAPDDPLAIAAVEAIRTGDVDALRRLLQAHPDLATARLASGGDCQDTRTLLHVVTDWPAHAPNGAATVAALVGAGADVDARFGGRHTETPLHWAASSDDVEVLDALLDAGADIEATGAVIAGGTPISDAAAFGQWQAARRLLERGAQTSFWESATLGLLDRVERAFAAEPPPAAEEVTAALWGACHGGQRTTAAYLLDRGADVTWIGWDDLTALDAAERSGAADVVAWLEGLGAPRAADLA